MRLELGYMFYHNFMGSPGDNLTVTQSFFSNIRSNQWSGTEFAPDPGLAWNFAFGDGGQRAAPRFLELGAWAVRSGDVLAAVPEPSTLALLGLGFAGLGLSRRRERSALK